MEDEAAPEREEGLVGARPALVAHRQASAAPEPGPRALHHPAVAAAAPLRRDPDPCDPAGDAPPAAGLPAPPVVPGGRLVAQPAPAGGGAGRPRPPWHRRPRGAGPVCPGSSIVSRRNHDHIGADAPSGTVSAPFFAAAIVLGFERDVGRCGRIPRLRFGLVDTVLACSLDRPTSRSGPGVRITVPCPWRSPACYRRVATVRCGGDLDR